MSILGPGGLGRIPIASSAAASAQTPANADEVNANRETARAHSDEDRLANRELGDNLETQVADRDPDGRLPWTARRSPQQEDEENDAASKRKAPSPDPDIGGKLDVDA